MKHFKLLTGLITSLLMFYAGTLQAKVNTNNDATQCPDVKLYRELSVSQRSTPMTLTDDPLYLSKHYCFIYWNGTQQDIQMLPAKYSFKQSKRLYRRYHRTYDTLSNDQRRVAFAHLYLKALAEQSLMLPNMSMANKIRYTLPVKDEGNNRVVLFSSNLANSKDYHLLYDGLLDLADKPPIDKNWPELVQLVELVLTNLDSKSAQTLAN